MSTVTANIAQVLAAKLRVAADINDPPTTDVFLSPGIRISPTTIYLLNSVIDDSPSVNNFVRAEDTYGDPRYISPNSTIDMGFYVNAYVGFGQVFSTQGEANSDAQQRLEDILGQYVNLDDIEFENISMSDVPSLWGPAVAEVRIWT